MNAQNALEVRRKINYEQYGIYNRKYYSFCKTNCQEIPYAKYLFFGTYAR